MLHVDPAAVRDLQDQERYQAALEDGAIPWTGLDPAKNVATLNAAAMTDDQRWLAGFNDAFNRRGSRASLSDYPSYQEGRLAGSAARF